MPAALRKNLPAYPLPILRLARLATDEAARGQGLGKELLRFVLQLAIRLAKDYGCTGVLVDAKAEAVAFYGKLGFVPLEILEGQSDARPAPIPMFLSVGRFRQPLGVLAEACPSGARGWRRPPSTPQSSLSASPRHLA